MKTKLFCDTYLLFFNIFFGEYHLYEILACDQELSETLSPFHPSDIDSTSFPLFFLSFGLSLDSQLFALSLISVKILIKIFILNSAFVLHM